MRRVARPIPPAAQALPPPCSGGRRATYRGPGTPRAAMGEPSQGLLGFPAWARVAPPEEGLTEGRTGESFFSSSGTGTELVLYLPRSSGLAGRSRRTQARRVTS